jgi:hypothetical protein
MIGDLKDLAINNLLVKIELIGLQIILTIWVMLFSSTEDFGDHITTTCPQQNIHRKLSVPEEQVLKEGMKTGNLLISVIVHVILNGIQIITTLEVGKFTILPLTKCGKPNGI